MVCIYIDLEIMILVYTILLQITTVITNTTVTVKIGDNVTLKCDADLTTDFRSISWFHLKPPKHLQYIVGTFKTSEYDGFGKHFQAIIREGIHYLQILNTKDSDSGIYYCGAISGLVVRIGNGTSLDFEDTESSSENGQKPSSCDIPPNKENWMNSVVVGLGVALGVCVAVMTLLIASHLKRSVCDHCKEMTPNQLHCNNPVLEAPQGSDAEMMNYSSLHFSTRRKKRGEKKKDLQPEAVYSDVKHLK
ncbi:programmed cell death protein 1-like isoform X2 [Clupea harengus]|uniref:Programmed cell death protein 1-like isoform X2 n=1 Tax=Clupea harengus TaxID=7950 RepID=A0A6P8FG69_CLUHA|nr:programmed cell death protein 1-like isoform X2 [Clupea harengus]